MVYGTGISTCHRDVPVSDVVLCNGS